jgi:hypothetical protein
VLLPRGEHFPHEDAALLMLAHHAEYPAGLGDAGGFEGGKEKLLLLAMVALVAEDHDELQHLAEMLRIDLLTVASRWHSSSRMERTSVIASCSWRNCSIAVMYAICLIMSPGSRPSF